jgi:NADPH-dependent glutamate synthase beta subunit-like oxidoreductase
MGHLIDLPEKELGVEIKTNHLVNSLKEIFAQGYRAIFLATGTWMSERLDIQLKELEGWKVAQPRDHLPVERGGKFLTILG